MSDDSGADDMTEVVLTDTEDSFLANGLRIPIKRVVRHDETSEYTPSESELTESDTDFEALELDVEPHCATNFNEQFSKLLDQMEESDGPEVQSSDYSEFELFEEASPKNNEKKKKSAASVSKLGPEETQLLQAANDSYLVKDFPRAMELYEQLIRLSANLPDPFHMLSLIHTELNQPKQAFDFLLLATSLTPQDVQLWYRAVELAREVGSTKQRIFCLRRCLSAQGVYGSNTVDPTDIQQVGLLLELAECSFIGGHVRSAARCFNQLHSISPHDSEVALRLARLHSQLGDLQKAQEVLMSCLPEEVQSALADDDAVYSIRTPNEHSVYLDQTLGGQYISVRQMEHAEDLVVQGVGLELLCYILDVFRRVESFTQSKRLVTLLLNSQPMALVPFRLLVRVACLEISLGFPGCPLALYCERELLENDYPSELHAMLADALYYSQRHDRALRLYIRSDLTDTNLWIRAGRCYLLSSTPEAAVLLLKQTPVGGSTQVLRHILLQKLGRAEEAIKVLTLMSPEDLVEQDYIPPALPDGDRVRILNRLVEQYKTLQAAHSVGDARPIVTLFGSASCIVDLSAESREKWVEWIASLKALVVECELDTQRLQILSSRRRFEKRLTSRLQNTRELHTHVNRLKTEYGLKPLEDLLGWQGYLDLLTSGLLVMEQLSMLDEAFRLIETVLNNKSPRKSLLKGVDISKQEFRIVLERLSLRFAVAAGYTRIGLGFVRKEYMKQPDLSGELLKAFSLLLFGGPMASNATMPLSTAPNKETLLENRSWLIRQLLIRPHNYNVIMIIGHFCVLSGRTPFAVAEYTRAWQLNPDSALALLCLAVSYLRLSMSRSVESRHSVAIRSFALLELSFDLMTREYQALADLAADKVELRVGNLYTSDCCSGLRSVLRSLVKNLQTKFGRPDTLKSLQNLVRLVIVSHASLVQSYNLARAHHQLNQLQCAIPLYDLVVEGLQTFSPRNQVELVLKGIEARFDETEAQALQWFLFRSCVPAPGQAMKVALTCDCIFEDADPPGQHLVTSDARTLARLASFNLGLALKSTGQVVDAKGLWRSGLVWR